MKSSYSQKQKTRNEDQIDNGRVFSDQEMNVSSKRMKLRYQDPLCDNG